MSLAASALENLPHNLARPAKAYTSYQRDALNRVYASHLPDWLKDGLAGAVAALLTPDGEFSASIKQMVDRGFYVRGNRWKHLTYKVIQYQVMTLISLGMLERLSGGRGRGKITRYRVHLDCLNTLPANVRTWGYANRNPLITRGVPSPKNTLRKHPTENTLRRRQLKTYRRTEGHGEPSAKELADAKRVRHAWGRCEHPKPCETYGACVQTIIRHWRTA